MKILLLLCLFPFLAFSQEAERYDKSLHQQRFGNYEVHYSVFNSTFLLPAIADAYQLTRGDKLAYVNISVLRIDKDGRRTPQKARVTGTEFDLVIQKNLNFKEIEEKNAIYYLATHDIQHKIPVYFTITVKPEGHTKSFTVKFRKLLYAD